MVRLRIRELAEQQGLNITELSRQARIGYSTAHALWHDKPQNLNRIVLDKVAKVLSVQVRDLFAEETRDVTPTDVTSVDIAPA